MTRFMEDTSNAGQRAKWEKIHGRPAEERREARVLNQMQIWEYLEVSSQEAERRWDHDAAGAYGFQEAGRALWEEVKKADPPVDFELETDHQLTTIELPTDIWSALDNGDLGIIG